jgi:hypothetical protein
LACGSVTALPLSVSRSSVRTFARFRNAMPADWLAADFVKNSGRRGPAPRFGKTPPKNRQQVFLSALRSGADEDELADQPSVLGRDLLGDAAAEGKAQQVDFGEAEQVDERDRVPGHRRDIVGRLARRAADPCVVEGNHRAIGGQGIHDGGIPRIDVAREMLQQNQRRPGRRAETAIGEADAAPSM